MTVQARLLSVFKPGDWKEGDYVDSPPFAVERGPEGITLVLREIEFEEAMDSVSGDLGLKKLRGPGLRYTATAGDAGKALREFDWFVRRAWKDPSHALLWGLAYSGERRGWSADGASLEELEQVTGLRSALPAALAGIFGSRRQRATSEALEDLATDKKLVLSAIAKAESRLPTWTEEAVMTWLCSHSESTVAEVHEGVSDQGIGTGAVYKVLAKLKAGAYVTPVSGVRVHRRGPARDLFTANCESCFFGFSSPENCQREAARRLEEAAEAFLGRPLTSEEATELRHSIQSVGPGARSVRKALGVVRVLHELKRSTSGNEAAKLLASWAGLDGEYPEAAD